MKAQSPVEQPARVKSRCVRATRLTLAEKREAAWSRLFTGRVSPTLTLERAWATYDRSLWADHQRIKPLIRFFGAARLVATLTLDDVDAYRESRRADGAVSKNTLIREIDLLARILLASVEYIPQRPPTRGDCRKLPRPCPYTTCAMHLANDVTNSGSLKVTFPDREPWELGQTCALDVADQGPQSIASIGRLVNVTIHRSEQLVKDALREMDAKLEAFGIDVPAERLLRFVGALHSRRADAPT